ncbi:MAG: hypothetical protein IPQ27_13150, partial [Chitinophagaceae bacterium]|nr:hypothetical protein [Chitinophagaceae bacterium]
GIANMAANVRKERFTVQKQVKTDFKSSHFDEPNILVHLRMNTRTDSEGNKVLFLEEVQSDWGQKGKKEGFGNKEKQQALLQKENDLQKQSIEILKKYNQFDKDVNFEYYSDDPDYAANKIKNKNSANKTFQEDGENLKILLTELDKTKKEISKGFSKEWVSDAPFVTDTNAWTKLALKVALKESVKQSEVLQRNAWEKMMNEKEEWIEARMKKLGKLEVKCP